MISWVLFKNKTCLNIQCGQSVSHQMLWVYKVRCVWCHVTSFITWLYSSSEARVAGGTHSYGCILEQLAGWTNEEWWHVIFSWPHRHNSTSLKKKKKTTLSFLSFNKWAKEAHLCKHLYNTFCKQFLHNDKWINCIKETPSNEECSFKKQHK